MCRLLFLSETVDRLTAQAISLHPLQTERLQKAALLLKAGTVAQTDPHHWQVQGSQDTPYLVEYDPACGWDCTCKDATCRERHCKHILACCLAEKCARYEATHLETPVAAATGTDAKTLFYAMRTPAAVALEPMTIRAAAPTTQHCTPCGATVRPGHVCPAPAPATASAEATFSLTLKGTIGGQDALLTARGQTLDAFQYNVDRIRSMLDAPAAPAQPPPQGQPTPDGWCLIHGAQMTRQTNTRGSWWSHKGTDGAWCHGKTKKAGRG